MTPAAIARQSIPSRRLVQVEQPVDPSSADTGRIAAPPSPARVVLHVILIAGGVALGLWTLLKLAPLIVVLLAAALFAYVIAPIVDMVAGPFRIAGRVGHLPRGAAIVVVYALIAGTVSGGMALLLPSATEQVNDVIARAPAYAEAIVSWENGWSRYYDRVRIPVEMRHSIDQSALAASSAAVESLRRSLLALAGALSYLPWLILIPILAFFLLTDPTMLRRALIKALPHRHRLRGRRLFDDLNAALAAYIRATLLACILVGTVSAAGFIAIGIPYPLLLGVMAGVLELIPLVGPLTVAVVAAIVGALHAPILALWAFAFLGILRLLEDYVVFPRLMRRGIHLHPLAVILAVLAGAKLYGVTGMFLAVPAMATAFVVYRHWREWHRDDQDLDAAVRPTSSTEVHA